MKYSAFSIRQLSPSGSHPRALHKDYGKDESPALVSIAELIEEIEGALGEFENFHDLRFSEARRKVVVCSMTKVLKLDNNCCKRFRLHSKL